MKVERLNGTMREREKVMRGMHSKKSAQKMVEAMRVYYNTCRELSKLKVTSTEAAGLKIDPVRNKIESLIRMASSKNLEVDGS